MSLSGGVMFYDGEGILTSGEPALVITNYFKKIIAQSHYDCYIAYVIICMLSYNLIFYDF